MNYKCLLVFHLPLLKCLPSPGSRQSVSQWVSVTNIRLEPPRHLCGIIWVINQLSKCSRIPFGHHDAPELLWRGCAFCLLLFLWRVAVCVYVCVRECLRESTLTGWDCNSHLPPQPGGGPQRKHQCSLSAQPAWLSAVNPSLGSIRRNYEPSPEVCLRFLPSIFVHFSDRTPAAASLPSPKWSAVIFASDKLIYRSFTSDVILDSYAGGGCWGTTVGSRAKYPLNFECPKYHFVGGRTRGKMRLLLWT